MKKYLLDTSTCVFLFRDNHDVAQRLNKIGRERCFICDVVLAELRYGAYKSDRTEENLKLIDDFVKEIKVLPFADSIDVYAQEKLRLKNTTPIHHPSSTHRREGCFVLAIWCQMLHFGNFIRG